MYTIYRCQHGDLFCRDISADNTEELSRSPDGCGARDPEPLLSRRWIPRLIADGQRCLRNASSFDDRHISEALGSKRLDCSAPLL